MPPVLGIAAGVLMAGGAIATAAGFTAVAFTVAGVAISWATLATVTGLALMAVSSFMMMKAIPKMGSQQDPGTQLALKLDGQAPVPVAYGEVASGGFLVYREASGDKNEKAHQIIVLSAGGPIEQFVTFYASDYEVAFNTDPATAPATATGIVANAASNFYKGKMEMRYREGLRPDTESPATYSGQPLPKNPGPLSGLAHAVWTNTYSTKGEYPNGMPKPLFWFKGRRLWDPRKDSTYPGGSGSHRWNQPETYEYSDNPALAALDWSLGYWENGKKVFGIGAPMAEVDVASFVSAANICEANDWRVSGVVHTTDDKFSVLASILQAGSATPVVRGAQISCIIDAPKTSIFSLDETHIVGQAKIQVTNSWRSRFNTVTPRYREPTQYWQVIPGEVISPDTYVNEDGAVKSTEVEFPLVANARSAHQLGAYYMVNSREMLTGTFLTKPNTLPLRPGDCFTANVAEMGLVNQKFMVMNREFDTQNLTINLTVKSETDAKHAFALGQTQVAPPSPTLTGGYDPSNPPRPSFPWMITGTSVLDANGVVIPAIVIEGTVEDPNAASVIAEYRQYDANAAIEDNWVNWSDDTASTANTTVIMITSGLKSNTSYEVSIRYRTVQGVLTQRLLLGPVTVDPLTIPWDGGAITGRPVNSVNQIIANSVAISLALQTVTLQEFANSQIAFNAATSNTLAFANAAIANALGAIDEAVANATETLSSEIDGLWGALDFSNAAIIELQNANATQASLISGLQTTVGNNTSRIGTLETTTANTATIVTGLQSSTANNTANIGILFQTTANSATAITSLQANGVGYDNRIVTLETANTSTVTRVTSLEAANTSTQSRVATLETANASTASRLTTLEVANGVNNTRIVNLETANTTQASQINQLTAGLNGANASITTVQTVSNTANTNANAALANALTANSKAQAAFNQGNTTASSLTTLTSTVNGHTSSISTLQTVTNGLNASWQLRVVAPGALAGMEVKANGATSAIYMIADNFAILNPGDTNTGNFANWKVPFEYSGGNFYLRAGAVNILGSLIVSNTITGDKIQANQITAEKIIGGAVTSSSWSEQGFGGTPGGQQVFALGHQTEINIAPHQMVFNVGITNFSGMNGMTFNFYRNGGYIGSRSYITQGSFGYNFGGMVFDQPGPGFNSYTVTAQLTPGSQSSPRLDYMNMMILELKR